jgi:hypothetical protein
MEQQHDGQEAPRAPPDSRMTNHFMTRSPTSLLLPLVFEEVEFAPETNCLDYRKTKEPTALASLLLFLLLRHHL